MSIGHLTAIFVFCLSACGSVPISRSAQPDPIQNFIVSWTGRTTDPNCIVLHEVRYDRADGFGVLTEGCAGKGNAALMASTTRQDRIDLTADSERALHAALDAMPLASLEDAYFRTDHVVDGTTFFIVFTTQSSASKSVHVDASTSIPSPPLATFLALLALDFLKGSVSLQ